MLIKKDKNNKLYIRIKKKKIYINKKNKKEILKLIKLLQNKRKLRRKKITIKEEKEKINNQLNKINPLNIQPLTFQTAPLISKNEELKENIKKINEDKEKQKKEIEKQKEEIKELQEITEMEDDETKEINPLFYIKENQNRRSYYYNNKRITKKKFFELQNKQPEQEEKKRDIRDDKSYIGDDVNLSYIFLRPQEEKEELTETEEPQEQEEQIQYGEGYKKLKGLSNIKINKIMNKINKNDFFIGVYSIDNLPYDKLKNRCGFIFNNKKQNEKGEHWIAFYIDVEKDKSIELYDSFGRKYQEYDEYNILNDYIKYLSKKYNYKKKNFIKFKENLIKNQNVNTDNCGYFCINFLLNRFNNVKFSKITGFDDIINNIDITYKKENEIENLKFKIFNYI